MDFEGEDFLAEAERKAKQKFLREEVIELNFDSRLFTYHCESKKAADIDLWTFEELQECVREFKMKYRASQTFEEFEEKLKRDKENEKRLYEIPIRKVPKAVEELKLEEAKTFETRRESNISESDNDIYIFPVQKAPETELIVSKDLKLEVLEATVVQEGFFGSSYVVYTVTTSPLGWEVKRRFTEFKWLSEVLSHEFPGYYIPPLPDKKAHGNTEDDTILKRQRFLQRYMNSIISNSVFKSSPSLVLFLQQSSSKELKSSKDHNKKTKRQTLDQFVSLKGEIMCDVREQVMKFASINQYLNSAETLKKKLKRQSEEIIDDFRKLSKTLTSYAETVKQLSDIQEILDFNIGHKDVFRSINEALLE